LPAKFAALLRAIRATLRSAQFNAERPTQLATVVTTDYTAIQSAIRRAE
jgi:hypothetical protein